MTKEKNNNVILIGFMGSGKTSIGLKLSYKLQLAICDTDKMIEAKEDMTISEIFAKKGESYFRKLETDLLYDISKDPYRRIYSLGGGTPVALQNQSLICRCGQVIYLKASPDTIYNRLKNDTTRPLLMCDDPKAKIENLINYRNPIYERCADYVVEVDGKDQGEIVEIIVSYLESINQ